MFDGQGYNMSEGQWGMNDIKRNGGKFLWKQIHNSWRLGVRIMYGAMWDECVQIPLVCFLHLLTSPEGTMKALHIFQWYKINVRYP